MSSPEPVPPKFNTTAELQQYQREQAIKAEQTQARLAADKAYFDAVQAQFRKDQAAAAAKGQNLVSQTFVTNDAGQGYVQSNLEAARPVNPAPQYVFNAAQGSRVVELSPKPQQPPVSYTGPQTAKQNAAYLDKITAGVPESGKPLPSGYSYAEPIYNQYFGTKRIGDIITEEVARGDRGLYAPRTTYDYGQVKDYLASYGRKSYNVQLNDSLSGEPYHYFVNLGNQPEYYGPANPFEGKVVSRTVGPAGFASPPSDDFYGAFVGTIANTPKAIVSGAQTLSGQKSNIELYPEIEGSVINSFLNLGGRALAGNSSDLNLLLFSRDMGNLAMMVQQNPKWAAGSLAASGLMFIPNKVLTPFKIGLEVLGATRAIRQAERISEPIGRMFGVETTGVQAVRVGKTGSELVPLARSSVGFVEARPLTVPAFKYAPILNIPKTSVSLKLPNILPGLTKTTAKALATPDAFVIQSGLEDVGLIGAKTGKTEIAQPLMSRAEAANLLGEGKGAVPEVPAKLYTELAQKESNVLKNVGTFISIRGPEATVTPIVKVTGGAKLSESVPFASTFGYSNKELLAAANTYRDNAALAAESLRAKGTFRPFDFGKATGAGLSTEPSLGGPLNFVLAGAKSEAEARRVTEALISGIGATEKGTKGADIAKAMLGIYGGTNVYGTNKMGLGIGGVTGAERTKARQRVEQETAQYLAYPQGTNSLAKQYLEQFVGPTSKGQLETTPQSKTFNPFNFLTVGSTKSNETFRTFLNPFTGQGQTPFTIPGLSPLTTPIQSPLETPIQTTVTTTPTPTPTKTVPPKNPLIFNLPGGAHPKKRRRDQYPKFYNKGLSLWRVDPLLNINTKELLRTMGLAKPEKRHRR